MIYFIRRPADQGPHPMKEDPFDSDEFKKLTEEGRRKIPHQYPHAARLAIQAWERGTKTRGFPGATRNALRSLRKLLKLTSPPMKTLDEARRIFDETEAIVREKCEPLREGELIFSKPKPPEL